MAGTEGEAIIVIKAKKKLITAQTYAVAVAF